jgi:hypothetical protein
MIENKVSMGNKIGVQSGKYYYPGETKKDFGFNAQVDTIR